MSKTTIVGRMEVESDPIGYFKGDPISTMSQGELIRLADYALDAAHERRAKLGSEIDLGGEIKNPKKEESELRFVIGTFAIGIGVAAAMVIIGLMIAKFSEMV